MWKNFARNKTDAILFFPIFFQVFFLHRFFSAVSAESAAAPKFLFSVDKILGQPSMGQIGKEAALDPNLE